MQDKLLPTVGQRFIKDLDSSIKIYYNYFDRSIMPFHQWDTSEDIWLLWCWGIVQTKIKQKVYFLLLLHGPKTIFLTAQANVMLISEVVP